MSKNRYDGILGALYGFAIGDAMGATTEFMDEHQIKAKYGQVDNIIGGGWLKVEAGQVTDDTQMTMCVIDAIMSQSGKCNGEILRQIAWNFVKWYQSKPLDIGNACARGIQNLLHGGTTVNKDDAALGNGSLMRALPLALMGNNFWELNVMQGKITHNNNRCGSVIHTYHNTINEILDTNEVVPVNTPVDKLGMCKMQPTGHILNTFNNAIYWSAKPTIEECIIGAVNHGGDSDTIAAISGSLSGARLGFSAIPEKWILGLNMEVRSALETFADYTYQYYLLKKSKIN